MFSERRMASFNTFAFHPVRSSIDKPTSTSQGFRNFKTTLTSSFKPLLGEFGQVLVVLLGDIPKKLKGTSFDLLNFFVDSTFEFLDQPLLPSQSNFAPVKERGKWVKVNKIQGRIPDDFPEGIYARNGANPLFGGLKSSVSIFGRSNHIWVEGEGMLHAIYFSKECDGNWSTSYNNRHVETETFKFDNSRSKPSFIPAAEGDPGAILSAYLLNMLRFGRTNIMYGNTNIFEHGGKFYAIAETHLPQEIDIFTLATLGSWDINGAWDRPFLSHPKKAPGTGELVTMGVNATKPFIELGVISADGLKLVHKVDLRFKRCTLSHDLGVTQSYNVLLDFPLVVDINRVIKGGSLIKFEEEDYARIGVMPRYGDSDSIKWFDVKTGSTFHIFNCFEDGNEVIMWGCRARGSVIPGPDLGVEKHDYFFRGYKRTNENSEKPQGFLFTRAYEWRLNMQTGGVKERNLTGTKHSMDFPMINENFTGLKNKYGYAQVVDLEESSSSSMPKYGGLVKLYFDELSGEKYFEDIIKVEYHMFPKNTYCSGVAFVSKGEGFEEDDGFIVTFIHNEENNLSQVYVLDAKKISEEPLAVITVPSRVPYGFHGTFISIPSQI